MSDCYTVRQPRIENFPYMLVDYMRVSCDFQS